MRLFYCFFRPRGGGATIRVPVNARSAPGAKRAVAAAHGVQARTVVTYPSR